jgi:hypothetical protein
VLKNFLGHRELKQVLPNVHPKAVGLVG